MAAPNDTPEDGALDWLKNAKPRCWVCGETRWAFQGVVLPSVHPNGTGADGPSPTTIGTARFTCERCHVVLEVDCLTAGIRTSPKQ
jgi:hypothetical protein